jgi:hypothetical protein
MDLRKKKKLPMSLKLNVNLDNIPPEEEHTATISSVKVNTDLFFLEPITDDNQLTNIYSIYI